LFLPAVFGKLHCSYNEGSFLENNFMKRFISLTIYFLLPAFLVAQKVVSIKVDGGINPASAEYIHKAIEKAQNEKAECLLIHLNTPGGLLTSTRAIVSDMLKSTVPIIVYVSPAGSHAGSAGVFITLAANVAAMAPGTNIGAAHPVSLQGMPDTIMNAKGTNDAAAFIRTIAEKRKRNIEWAEDAVRNSVSITDEEAIEKNVIDYIANDDRELLIQIDGKKMEVNGGIKILQTKNATIESEEMGFFQKILDRLSDPNIAYLLMMIGFYGILFELFNPGAIFPGIVGVISLIFAFYSMSSMPVNYAGLSLIIFGIILFLLEIKIISHGLLTIGGLISVLLGSLFLFRSSPAENFVAISWTVITASTLLTALFFLFVIGMGLKAQRSKPATGIKAFIGKKGEVISLLDPQGLVKVNGEMWKAESLSGKINPGENIIVREIKNLTLYVEQG
jgi:membrane-bound serine protease (ClpP class)